jgi:hypothetical protein
MLIEQHTVFCTVFARSIATSACWLDSILRAQVVSVDGRIKVASFEEECNSAPFD